MVFASDAETQWWERAALIALAEIIRLPDSQTALRTAPNAGAQIAVRVEQIADKMLEARRRRVGLTTGAPAYTGTPNAGKVT